MNEEKKERRVCDTCLWYDPFLDSCWKDLDIHRSLAGPEGCGEWEREAKGP